MMSLVKKITGFKLLSYFIVLLSLGLLDYGSNILLVEGLGVNWGTMASHELPPKTVVQLLLDNDIKKVKLFDANLSTMNALAGTDIEVMVAIPNDQLLAMNDVNRAKDWVRRNVTQYSFNGGVNIKFKIPQERQREWILNRIMDMILFGVSLDLYVAVGNEPFLTSYNDSFVSLTFPALRNIQNALNDAGVGSSIKATVPLNADVYFSPTSNSVPSAGQFLGHRISRIMSDPNCAFLASEQCTLLIINTYNFFESPYAVMNTFSRFSASFDGVSQPIMDGNIQYTNVFDANFDTLVSSLKALGFGDMPILVGEVGWPTDGDRNANINLASRFYNGLLPRLAQNKGTPLRPGYIEVYLFGLIDEDAKSIAPGNFERHWGIFRYDGQPKFPMDFRGHNQKNKFLVRARNVQYLSKKWCALKSDADISDQQKLEDNINYACTYADCTALGYGSSCGGLDTNGNASYAFNAFFQVQNQDNRSCNFQGLAAITTQNISQGTCNFIIQMGTSSSWRLLPLSLALLMPSMLLLL
ncbi:hypothetical protein Leryth_001229 [Lithospermum erythrorhizon]|nr:hypothetical protein Leryth_001229 [Lithospermum erythrorhizon]